MRGRPRTFRQTLGPSKGDLSDTLYLTRLINVGPETLGLVMVDRPQGDRGRPLARAPRAKVVATSGSSSFEAEKGFDQVPSGRRRRSSSAAISPSPVDLPAVRLESPDAQGSEGVERDQQ